jgi:energy-coupling factor transport system substrate-specific component
MWRGLPLEPLRPHWLRFILAALLGGMSCALVVGFGLSSLKLLPFSIIAVAVILNNVLVALILGPFLLKLLAPRVGRWDLYWEEQMAPEDCRPGPAPGLGLILAWTGAAGGYLLGLAVSTGLITWPALPPLPLLLAIFLVLLILGCVLM